MGGEFQSAKAVEVSSAVVLVEISAEVYRGYDGPLLGDWDTHQSAPLRVAQRQATDGGCSERGCRGVVGGGEGDIDGGEVLDTTEGITDQDWKLT